MGRGGRGVDAPTRPASPCASACPGGVGKTSGPADFTSWLDDVEKKSWLDDVEKKLFGQLGGDTSSYPGLGHDSTLGAERPALGEGAPAAGNTSRRRKCGIAGDTVCVWR
jgi:hypothetical protein